MIKHSMEISMEYDGGIVLFDPSVFCEFLENHECTSGDLFDFFKENSNIGDAAIATGSIIPLYPINEDTYRFVVLTENMPSTQWSFTHQGFPLRVDSGILVATDLFSLYNWEHEFFKQYRENYSKKSSVNDMVTVDRGYYSVDISGGLDGKGKLYGLLLHPVTQLVTHKEGIDINSFNFNIG